MYKRWYTRGVPLTLYRRHLKSCRVHKTKLSPRAKRHFLDCECPIWMYGKTDKVEVPRQSTGTTDMKVAEAQRQELVASSKDKKIHGRSIQDAVQEYLDSREGDISEKTHGQIVTILERLRDYCKARNVHHMSELAVDIIESYSTSLKSSQASTTRSTVMAKIRTFLKEAYRRDWIEKPMVEKLKSVKAVYEQKEPYAEEHVTLILDQAEKMNGGREGYAGQPKTFRLLLELMLETGMRCGDAVVFDPSRVVKGERLWIYPYFPEKQKKNEKPKLHEVFLRSELLDRIKHATWMSKALPFHYGESDRAHRLAGLVYQRMQTIGERCDVKDCRPHRLRDTYAVRMLLRGVSLDDLSRLLGHSSVKVTESHYAKWVPARSRRLEAIVAQSLLHP